MLKSLEYSIRYINLILIFYYICFLKIIYVPNFLMLAIIPVNFLAIHYGILYKIKKDNYVTKYYILMSLMFLTTLFNLVFLSLVKTNMFVIVFAIFVNAVELIYLDLPSKNDKKKSKEEKKIKIIDFDKKKVSKKKKS